MAIKDGGPAFPLFFPESKARDGRVTRARDEHPGMSLRDHFAGQALAGMLASPPVINRAPDKVNHAGWALNAYRFADAMLAAREKSDA